MKFLFTLIITMSIPFQAISNTSNAEEQIGIQIDTQKKVDKYLRGLKNVPKSRFRKHAVLQILDKTTAKSLDQKIALNEKFSYGNIQITVHKCWQAPLSQKPDSKILLEVNEVNPKDETDIQNIFLGWMVASSPSVSGLQHPIYDITALDCQD